MTINSFDVRPHVILCCGRVVAVTMSDRYDFTWWKPCDPGRKRSLSLAIKGTPSRRFASRSVEGCDTRGRCGGRAALPGRPEVQPAVDSSPLYVNNYLRCGQVGGNMTMLKLLLS